MFDIPHIDQMNIGSTDLNLLVIFDTLMRERNVTRAAAMVGLTQPSMSNALARLRRQFNDPLFVRTTKGMEPTTLAYKVAPSVAQGLEMLQRGLDQPAGFSPSTSTRTFRLLMSDIAEAILIPRLVKVIQTEAPGVTVRVVPAARDDYEASLHKDAADLAIGNLVLGENFYQQRLFEDRYVCLGAEYNAPTQRMPLRKYLAASHIKVTSSRGDSLVDEELHRRGYSRRISLEMANFLAVPSIVQGTELLVTLPSTALGALPMKAGLRSFSLPFSISRANVRQYWHVRYHHDAASQWLRKKFMDIGASLMEAG